MRSKDSMYLGIIEKSKTINPEGYKEYQKFKKFSLFVQQLTPSPSDLFTSPFGMMKIRKRTYRKKNK